MQARDTAKPIARKYSTAKLFERTRTEHRVVFHFALTLAICIRLDCKSIGFDGIHFVGDRRHAATDDCFAYDAVATNECRL